MGDIREVNRTHRIEPRNHPVARVQKQERDNPRQGQGDPPHPDEVDLHNAAAEEGPPLAHVVKEEPDGHGLDISA